MKQCQNCKKDYDDSMKFCPYCGTPAAFETGKAFCGHCGAKLESGTRFCPACGVTTNVDGLNSSLPASVEPESWTSSAPPDAIVMQSSAPISTKTGWAKWGYIGALIIGALTGGAGLLLVFVVLFVETIMIENHRGKIRRMRFKFVDGVTPDQIYNKLQPILTQKYSGDKIKFDRDDNTIIVEYDSLFYDINLNDDCTFSVWWRKSIAGAIFSFNEWKLYRKVRTGTALVAYELQRAFGITR